MELLSNKLNEMQGSSAIIVSHDMRLSMDFADVIIKIKKSEMKITRRVNNIEYTEIIFYGKITDESVYMPTDSTRKAWTNTINEYTDVEFEQFLKRG
jgi:ABC-type phosphate/phosphonate transport system ATPase subunit